MQRESILYKIRRKCQVVAFYILPHEFLSKVYCRIVLKQKVNIRNPQTFNEKIQWYKLYYCPKNPLVVQCTDKFQVREYLAKKAKESGVEIPTVNLIGNNGGGGTSV